MKHREEQTRICEKYVLPVIAEVACRELTRADFQEIIDLASIPSVAHHIRRTLTALMGAGVEEGYVMVGRDLLRGIRWRGESTVKREPADPAVAEDEIPTVAAVHDLAAATAALTGVWWRELQILLVAYSGMRWGEQVALTWEQVDADRRRIRLDRQVVEARNALIPTLPKGRRRRITMFPVTTPGGVALAELVQRRMDELEPASFSSRRPGGVDAPLQLRPPGLGPRCRSRELAEGRPELAVGGPSTASVTCSPHGLFMKPEFRSRTSPDSSGTPRRG